MRSRRRRTAASALLVIGALLLAGCTAPADAVPDGRPQVDAPFAADITERLDAALSEAMTLSGSSGAIAGVWAPWAGEWVVSPGTTALGGNVPLSTDMRFRIAGNTRSMTCTVLLKLVDDGVVKLSDPVSEYLTRLSDIDGITLGQLCQNTSGLPDYVGQLAPHFVNNPTREWPPLEVLSSGFAANRLGEPGSTFAESSTGFVLLGLALEAATNKHWPTLYQQYIFEPLGMNDTWLPEASEVRISGSHPHGYAAALTTAGQTVCEAIRDETDLSPSVGWVAGGAVSTVGDLKTWVQSLAEGRLLSKKAAKAQWATVPMGEGAPSWQSYGLGVQQLGPLRGHAGAIPGFLSAMLSDPSSGLTVVVMLNNSTAGATFVRELAQRLASIASKAPAAPGEKAPLVELPWAEEQNVAAMQAAAVCAPPAAAPPAA
jgi:D-alanyl-D-alanine carboxypeptidase